jgi:hypothetical protein
MSLAKAAPNGLKDHECKKMALRERPPIPYVPEKDSVQEMVSSYKDNHLKMLIKERKGAMSSLLAHWYARGFSHPHGISRRSSQEKGLLQVL